MLTRVSQYRILDSCSAIFRSSSWSAVRTGDVSRVESETEGFGSDEVFTGIPRAPHEKKCTRKATKSARLAWVGTAFRCRQSEHGLYNSREFCLGQSISSGSNSGWSSGDTLPNCLGEFREIRESNGRTGIAADVHQAGTPRAAGVEHLQPRENGQRGARRGRFSLCQMARSGKPPCERGP